MIAYVGPLDVRYFIPIVAAIKTGYVVSALVSITRSSDLLDDCFLLTALPNISPPQFRRPHTFAT